jgi:hypothetical protein
MFTHHRRLLPMRTILHSSTAIVAAVAIVATAARDTAQAASRFDGSWIVQITTRRGACDPSSSFGVEIHDGIVSGAGSGRVSKSGAVSVSVSSGGSYASGSGRLSTSSGGGSWHGVGSRRMLRNMGRRPSVRTVCGTIPPSGTKMANSFSAIPAGFRANIRRGATNRRLRRGPLP